MAATVRAALAVVILALSTAMAFADDWVAVRLRGTVLQLMDGEWHKLHRGDVVPDNRAIRTLRMANVEFQRGAETITVGPDSAIQIYDEVRAKPFTTVKQYFGSVTVEAEVRDVQHFAVQNSYLAAVVKGTKFTVTAGEDGASVDVERGAVFVQDRATENDVTVGAGQSATVDKSHGRPVVSGDAKDTRTDKSSADPVITPLGRLLDDDTTVVVDAEEEPTLPPGKTKPDNPKKPENPGKPEKPEKPDKDDDDTSGKGKPDDKGKPNNNGKGKSVDEPDDD